MCMCACVCVRVCNCVYGCAHGKRGHVCCRVVVVAVTNLPGPPDGSRSKVTELWLDKHRSPASISHPVHFGNTWLFLGALGPGKKRVAVGGGGQQGERRGREEGEPQERHSDGHVVKENSSQKEGREKK